jgi:2',3'-cyclic-nucleotide 2'-phosphodiesterase (5'-nucleotidase family)
MAIRSRPAMLGSLLLALLLVFAAIGPVAAAPGQGRGGPPVSPGNGNAPTNPGTPPTNPGNGNGNAPSNPGSGSNAPGSGEIFELTVLHHNDGESALIPTASDPGAARFVADLQALQDVGRSSRQEPRAAITISSGDNYLAGPRLQASFENPGAFYDALVYTTAGFDAMTIGNHEFDFGPGVLADFIEAAGDLPFISANLDFSSEPRLAALEADGRIAASTVVTKEGRDIGIVGATTTQLGSISSPGRVTISEVLPAVQAEVDDLTAAGIDIILLSSHLQDLAEELELIPNLRDVDAVIGGGGAEDLRDNYPLIAIDADGNEVPVVTTPGDYRDIGKLVLNFDRDGDLVSVGEDSALLAVPLEGPVNQFIVDNVEAPVAAYVAGLGSNVIATTEVPLDGRSPVGVRTRETNLGNLMADGLLTAARLRAAEFGLPQADIALQNGGGMRQNRLIPPGPVTELDSFDIAAFSNFVSVAQIDGVALKSALERSVSAQPAAGGFHGQWAGIRFTFDTSRPAQTIDFLDRVVVEEGSRIIDAVVTRADGTTVVLVDDGVLVGGDEMFTIASIDFILRSGGDGYFSLEVPFTTIGISYQRALFEQFVRLGTVTEAQYPDVSGTTEGSTPFFTRFGPVTGFSLS